MSRSRIVLTVLAVVVVSAIGLLTSTSTEANQGQGQEHNRTIQLSPPAGAPDEDAGGSVQLQITPTGNFFTLRVHNLQSQNGSRAYAFYASTPTLGRSRFVTFNTPFGGTYTNFGGLAEPEWHAEPVTVQVCREADDGDDAPDVGGLLVLSGEDAGV